MFLLHFGFLHTNAEGEDGRSECNCLKHLLSPLDIGGRFLLSLILIITIFRQFLFPPKWIRITDWPCTILQIHSRVCLSYIACLTITGYLDRYKQNTPYPICTRWTPTRCNVQTKVSGTLPSFICICCPTTLESSFRQTQGTIYYSTQINYWKMSDSSWRDLLLSLSVGLVLKNLLSAPNLIFRAPAQTSKPFNLHWQIN